MVFNTKFKNGITDFPQFVVNGININEALFEDNDSGAANEVITDYAGFTTPDDEPKAIHRGIDFAAQGGKNVSPIVGGVVSEVGNNFVTIEDSTGTNWVYGNIENTLELERGDVVTTRDLPDIVETISDLTTPGFPEFPEFGGIVESKTTPEDLRIEDRIGKIQEPKDESALDKAENLLHLEVLPEPTGVSSIKLDKDEGKEDVIKRDTFNPVAEFENTKAVEDFKGTIFDRSTPGTYTIQASTDPSVARSVGKIKGNVYDDSEENIRVRDVSIEKYSEGDINPNAETWVISHGWNGNPDTENFQNLAQTISDKGKQVVSIDWSDAANTGKNPFSDPREAATWITDVAGFASDALTDIWGISSDSLNLVGHSLGTYLSAEIGNALDGVSKLVALDPATTASKPFGDFTADVNNDEVGTQQPTDFREVADFSRAFWGDPNLSAADGLGSRGNAQTANESFKVEFAPVPDITPLNEGSNNHGNIVKLYDKLIGENGEINNKFNLDDTLGTSSFGPSPSGDGPIGRTGPLTSGNEGKFLGTEVMRGFLSSPLTDFDINDFLTADNSIQLDSFRFRGSFGEVNTVNNSSVSTASVGSDESDNLTGSDSKDTILGNGDDDVIEAAADDDIIRGGSGRDTLEGSSGSDRLEGGLGTDILTGGAGRDAFAGTPEELNGDTVTDFSEGDIVDFFGVEFDRSDLSISSGSAILEADTDGDGDVESTVTLEGEDINAERSFVVGQVDNSTLVALDESSTTTDFVITKDLTGLFAEDLPNLQTAAPVIEEAAQELDSDIEFGVASFKDQSVGDEFGYRADQPRTNSIETIVSAIEGLSASGGGDFAESQLTALVESARGSDLNLREGSERIILLNTDADYKSGGDFPTVEEAKQVLDDIALRIHIRTLY